MTVHGAKGLEAPVVILADAGPHDDPTPGRLLWGDDGLPFWRSGKTEQPALVERLAARDADLDAEERRRLLYLALTRAKDRLHVTGRLGKRASRAEAGGTRPPRSWHDHVRQALAALPDIGSFTLDLGCGIAGPALRMACGVVGAAGPEPWPAAPATPPLPAWAGVAAAPEPAIAQLRAPSQLGDLEPPAASPRDLEAAARFRFGRHVHKLLQLLPDLPEPERGSALARYLARAHDLSPAARGRARRQVEAVLAHPELAAAFGPGSRAEQAICGVVGGIAVAGQIDRLLVSGGRVLVVDYKTDRQPPAAAADTPIAYLRQMAAYRELLRRIHPERRVEAVLVWTETGEVTGLEAGLLDAHMPGAARPDDDGALA
jgi:ATP-dependent helicase/nuclease subunit A